MTTTTMHYEHTTLSVSADVEAAAVRVQSLRKVIDDRVVLRDVEFMIERGTFVALLGANGAGKSTLLRILAGLVPPTDGSVQLFGEQLKHDSPNLRARIGLIGHSAMLYRELSARENLIFFARLHDLPQPARRADVLLEQVGLLHRADDAVKTFSRGMVQRVAIARALLCNPDLLLADEPFAGLDAPSAHALEETLAVLHAQGKTIILANHDVRQSLAISQRTMLLHEGRLVIDAPSAALNGRDLYTAATLGGRA